MENSILFAKKSVGPFYVKKYSTCLNARKNHQLRLFTVMASQIISTIAISLNLVMWRLQSAVLPLVLLLASSSSYTHAFTSAVNRYQKNAAVGGYSSTARFASTQTRRGARANNKNALVMMPSSTPMVPWQVSVILVLMYVGKYDTISNFVCGTIMKMKKKINCKYHKRNIATRIRIRSVRRHLFSFVS